MIACNVAASGILGEQVTKAARMLYLLALSQSCIDAEEMGFDILETGCRVASTSSGPDVLGGFIVFGLIMGGCLIAKGEGQL